MGSCNFANKGCFASCGTNSKVDETTAFHNCLPIPDDLDSQMLKLSVQSYKQGRDAIRSHIDEVLSGINSELLGELILFCQNPVTPDMLPAGVVLLGVNMADHGRILSGLQSSVRSSCNGIVVILNPATCRSMRSTLNEILSKMCSGTKMTFKNKLLPVFDDVITMYEDVVNESDVTTERPLVFVFDDFESFTSVVDDLIMLLYKLKTTTRIPVVCLLVVSTTIDAVCDVLGFDSLSKLCLRHFQPPPPTVYICSTLEALFITNPLSSFYPGPNLTRYLVDKFLYGDFAINSTQSALEVAFMEHSLNPDFGFLSLVAGGQFLHKMLNVDCLDDKSLYSRLCSVPSFVKYVGSLAKMEARKIKKCPKEVFASLTNQIRLALVVAYPKLDFLHELSRTLPSLPLGKYLYTSYMHLLSGTLDGKLELATSLWCLMSKEGLLSAIEAGLTLLAKRIQDVLPVIERLESDDGDSANGIVEYVDHVKDLYEEMVEDRGRMDVDAEEAPVVAAHSGDTIIMPSGVKRKLGLQELQNQLRTASKRPVYNSNFHLLRKKFFAFITEHIQSPCQFPLSELLFYDDVEAVKSLIDPPMKLKIHLDLVNPNLNFPNVVKPNNYPSTCKIYQLYTEQCRTINLHDWLQAYVAMECEEDGRCKRTAKKARGKSAAEVCKVKQKTLPDELFYFFNQSLSELELMGFVAPNKRKTDHIIKLCHSSFL